MVICRCLGARPDRAVKRHHARGADPLDHFEHRAVDLGDDLDHAVMVAQIDEDEVAVIALAMYPTRDTDGFRSEEHTSELQSLMRISYAVFCLKKKTQRKAKTDKLLPHPNIINKYDR